MTTTCDGCGNPNPVWFTANSLWNRVVPEKTPILCPTCFIERAERDAGLRGAWVLKPERETEATWETVFKLVSPETAQQLQEGFLIPPGRLHDLKERVDKIVALINGEEES